MLKVRIPSYESQTVLDGDGGDPDIVLWERTAEKTQRRLYLTIHACGRQITGNNIRRGGEGIQVRKILFGSSRSSSSEKQLSQYDHWDEDSIGW